VEIYDRVTGLVGRGEAAEAREDLTHLSCLVLNKYYRLAPTDCHTVIHLLRPTVLQRFAGFVLRLSQLLKFGLPIYSFAGSSPPFFFFPFKSAALKRTPPP